MKNHTIVLFAFLAACSLDVRIGSEANALDTEDACACEPLRRTLEASYDCGDAPAIGHTMTRQTDTYSARVSHPQGEAPGELVYGRDGVLYVTCPYLGATVDVYATVPADEVAHAHP